DLVEAELLVVVRPDPFGGVDRALLQRRIDVAAGEHLGDDTHATDDVSGETEDAHLQSLEVVDRLDLLAEPPAHLRAGAAAREAGDVAVLVELAHQLAPATPAPPGILLA